MAEVTHLKIQFRFKPYNGNTGDIMGPECVNEPICSNRIANYIKQRCDHTDASAYTFKYNMETLNDINMTTCMACINYIVPKRMLNYAPLPDL